MMSIVCGDCGRLLHAQEHADVGPELISRILPCAHCGGSTPNVAVTLSERLVLRDAARYKAGEPGRKRQVLEGRQGSELHRKSGEWRSVYRKIDRTSDVKDEHWYEEVIKDEAGNVIREVSEPLRDHQGRGSARAKGAQDEDSV